MTKKELIARLEKFPDDMEIMIMEGNNGGNWPRELNFGPRESSITMGDAESVAECEGRAGEKIIVIGYGCY